MCEVSNDHEVRVLTDRVEDVERFIFRDPMAPGYGNDNHTVLLRSNTAMTCADERGDCENGECW